MGVSKDVEGVDRDAEGQRRMMDEVEGVNRLNHSEFEKPLSGFFLAMPPSVE